VKTKCSATGNFVVTGFVDEEPGKLDHVRVAERIAGELVECGQVRFGVGRELRAVLEELQTGVVRDGVVTVEPRLSMPVRYFGRHRSGALRDGVFVHRRGP
jgi:ATP-dependent DNA ligase